MLKNSISSQGANEAVLSAVVNHAQGLNKECVTIFEVGSGKGALAKALCERLDALNIKYEMQCSDIEPHQINDQNLDFSCKYINAQEPFELDKKYDIGIAVEIIEHIENPFHLIREFAKNLQPDALFVVTSPNTLSLSSRFRYFMSGTYDYFRRPYNEYWLNMGHVNPINPLQLIYILRKNGFEIEQAITNKSTLNSLLLLPLVPFIYLYSFFHYILRENREGGKEQKQRNRKTLRTLMSPGMLTGKIAIYQAKRTRDIVAENEIWFQSDKNFNP